MKRSRLRNKFLNTRSDIDRKAYNKQRNYVVSLLRKKKKEFYSNLNTDILTENKTFWKTVKPFLADKTNKTSRITLIEDKKTISQDIEIAKTFNEYFISVPIKNMPSNQEFECLDPSEKDPLLRIIKKYQNHPSIKLIKAKNKSKTFRFRETNTNEIKKFIQNLDAKKASQNSDMSTKVLTQNAAFFAKYSCDHINASICSSKFHNELKEADIVPVHKKKSKLSKENYRPISILPNISKVYERCLYDQMSNFFEVIFSKYQCGFRKGYSAQHCLLVMIEKWKRIVDYGGVFGALLTDLSKAFDCIPHDLFIAKLEAYGFQIDALKLIYDYLSNRKQTVKINETFSSWKDIEFGVPQGSILGPLLFNIHLCDLFYFLEDLVIASYADDTTIYTVKENKESVINTLETSSVILFKWFENDFMKANSDKSHLLLSCKQPSTVTIDDTFIESNVKEVLLGIIIDRDLKFDDHVNNLCKKACQKLNALSRLAPFMNLDKRIIIMKAFIESQFGYCPLAGMFHSRSLNNKINRIHERALRITYNDKSSNFQELLDKDNSVTIHHRNIRTLAIETYKFLQGLSPPLFSEIFVERELSYSLRGDNPLARRRVNSVRHRTESVSFLAPKIWDILPKEIKDSKTLNVFKTKLKK